jgi:mannose-6-phosphate isomerase-like protein (cupin superfamily)
MTTPLRLLPHLLGTLLCAGLGTGLLYAQSPLALYRLRPPADFDNVHVQRVVGDSLSTGFVIWIKESVPLHFHAAHSETVLVLRGKGDMYLDGRSFPVRKGDLVFIPQGTHHGVEVKGRMLQVLSSQSPWFDGTDRVKVVR